MSLKERFRADEVLNVQRCGDVWCVKTKNGGDFTAKNVVMALPITVSEVLLKKSLRKNKRIKVHMWHLRGELHHKYQNVDPYILLSPRVDGIALVAEPDGSYLYYSRTLERPPNYYFKNYEVLKHIYWNPAFYIGNKMIEQEYADNLWVVGDHILCSMEDAYISGIFAANRIIAKRQKVN